MSFYENEKENQILRLFHKEQEPNESKTLNWY